LGASSTALRPRGKAFLVAAINRNYLSRSAPHQLPTALTRAEDTLAIDIYRRAEESGEEISLGTVERRLSELLAHEPGCCGPCTAAASVRPQGVWWVVRAWVGRVNATRRRARR
jgi:hypothetical protein